MKVQQTTRDAEHGGLARRVAVLEEKLRGVLEGNTRLREENAALRRENQQLREEVVRLKRQLAAARKNSSTSSKPPSSDHRQAAQASAKGWQEAQAGRPAGP